MDQQATKPNLRRSRRQKPKGSTRVRCFKGSMGLGANLAIAVLDVSETGIRLLLKDDLPRGQEVEVNLDSGSTRPVKMVARVIWSVATTAGQFCVGASFEKPISYADLSALARV